MTSKYTDQIDAANMICPYCGDSYQVECEDYSEDLIEEECEECGKKYYSRQNFSVDHYSAPDCELNNEFHKWELLKLSDGSTHPFCSICGKCKEIT